MSPHPSLERSMLSATFMPSVHELLSFPSNLNQMWPIPICSIHFTVSLIEVTDTQCSNGIGDDPDTQEYQAFL